MNTAQLYVTQSRFMRPALPQVNLEAYWFVLEDLVKEGVGQPRPLMRARISQKVRLAWPR